MIGFVMIIKYKRACVLVAACFSCLTDSVSREGLNHDVDINWDSYGVPHIFSEGEEALFYGFGWSQMESHGNLILKLYAMARGESAAYWGVDYVDSDILVRSLGVGKTAKDMIAAQSEGFSVNITAFVNGMNAFAAKNPDRIAESNKIVLPVRDTDVFAHLIRVIDFGFLGRREIMKNQGEVRLGSNAIAISDGKAKNGNAILYMNPHLPWGGFYTLFEAHLRLSNRDMYGVTLVGMPVLIMGFNNEIAWAHTKNELDGSDLYEIPLDGEHFYRFDSERLPLREEKLEIEVAVGEMLESRRVSVFSSEHGPVIRGDGDQVLSYRSTRSFYPGIYEQYWNMIRSRNLTQFTSALSMMQIPLFNVVYADRDGNILYMWNGILPRRTIGDSEFWSRSISGSESELLWKDVHSFEDLPLVINPVSGWLQNTNDPPWTCTIPQVFDKTNYPLAIPRNGTVYMRSQQVLDILSTNEVVDFEKIRELRFSNNTEFANRLLGDLLVAIDEYPVEKEFESLLGECKMLLSDWNACLDSESTGSVLFKRWVDSLQGEVFANLYNESNMLTTPNGLANREDSVATLLKAAREIKGVFSRLDVAWGDVYRLVRGKHNYPARGGSDSLGVLHTVEFSPVSATAYQSVSGDSFSAIIEFSDPLRAEVLLSYGNSSEVHSEHRGDQLKLLSVGEMRPALIRDEEVLASSVRKEHLIYGKSPALVGSN